MNLGDKRLDRVVSVVLRVGVTLAAALVLIGGIAFLVSHPQAMPDHRKFHAASNQLASVRGVLDGALNLDPLYIIQLGLLILIATPVVRVMTCAGGFALERDWTYTAISLIVLALLIASLIGSGL
jgi:uncharacterized membrane protein